MLDKTFGVNIAEQRGLSPMELASLLEGRNHLATFFRVNPFQRVSADYCPLSLNTKLKGILKHLSHMKVWKEREGMESFH